MSYASRSNSKELVKRPTLSEVLSDATAPPYTLKAFMTYLSESHCLETLQFTLAAKEYCETYNSFVDQAGEPNVTTDPSAGRHLRMLYQLLLTTYIIPGAPREVNLSSDMRDSLLRYKDQLTPPYPRFLSLALSDHPYNFNNVDGSEKGRGETALVQRRKQNKPDELEGNVLGTMWLDGRQITDFYRRITL
ncbi:uncharacterized protein N7525_008894 [Penicillium rubens]|uniref:RGS domain-containing protein n=1 Tax=Penicillium chrysogenum TaxID=5076 RepID=A0ABQ8WMN4_PENCH|nr:uncharacterized protein N7525_008894 [Penicillium rubens]KAJ5271032.1 hypothetical protein N7505_006790 [Penicillium chrysogenum]KAJ5830641.1 hypothetical protein N7525_008894 [Penicillium rubens]